MERTRRQGIQMGFMGRFTGTGVGLAYWPWPAKGSRHHPRRDCLGRSWRSNHPQNRPRTRVTETVAAFFRHWVNGLIDWAHPLPCCIAMRVAGHCVPA